MKRFLAILAILSLFIGIVPSVSAQDQAIGGYPELLQLNIPLTGTWRVGDNPLLIQPGDFADLANLRPTKTGIEGVSGYSKINTAPFYGDYNYTDFTEDDTPTRISVAAHTITVASLDTDEQVSCYYDEGAAFFDGDFEHQLEFKCTASTNGVIGLWGLSNTDPAGGLGLFGLADGDLDHLALRWDLGSELIVNNDMELDANWSNNGTPTTNERSSEQKHGGAYSRKFIVDAANEGIKSDTFSTTTGKAYTFSFSVYPVDNTNISYSIKRGGDTNWVVQGDIGGLLIGSWNTFTFSYTESLGGSEAYIIFHSGVQTSGTWYIDDASYKPNCLILQETNGATDTTDSSIGLALNTDYYLTIKRDYGEGDPDFGSLECTIYSDETRATSVDTLTVTLTEQQNFQWILGVIGWKEAGGGDSWSGTISNLTGAIYDNILSGYHFTKDQPSESHVLIQAQDEAGNTAVFDNKTAIPSQGNFDDTALRTDASGASTGRFASAAQGNLIYCNTVETPLIWGGDEAKCMAFIGTTAAVTNTITNPRDFTSQVQNTLQTTSEIVSIATPYLRGVIGSPVPLKGVKFYVKTANDTVSTLNFQEWTGAAWSDLTETDGTRPGDIALAKTGTITWATTETTSKKKYLDGTVWYWYQWVLSAGTAEIYHVTLDAAIQPIQNIWDQTPSTVSACLLYNGTTFEDYSDEVNSEITTDVFILDDLAAANYFVLGFEKRQQGFEISIVGDGAKENTTAATVLTVSYWDGDSWVGTSALNDGTSDGGISLARSGVITFSPVAKGTEFTKTITGEDLLFYYHLTFDDVIDAETEIYYIQGIPAPEDILPYEFPLHFQNRTLLCNRNGAPNEILVSAVINGEGAPYVLNGPDSATIHVGTATNLIAGAPLSNSYESSIDAVAVACKKSETWTLREPGDGGPNFIQHQLSDKVGCVAPLTMDTCELAAGLNLAAWVSHIGPVMCDGVSMKLIPGIEPYFDPTDSLFLGYSTIESANGFFDLSKNEYNLIAGSNWLVYSMSTNKWFPKEPPQYPQRGWQVQDVYGGQYCYLAFSDGYMRRNEHSNAYDGADIDQSVTLADIALAGLGYVAQLDLLKLTAVAKNTGTQETITVSHRADGVESWTTLDSVEMYETGKRYTQHTQRPNKQGVTHQLKLEVSTDDQTNGMEPLHLDLFYKVLRTDTEID